MFCGSKHVQRELMRCCLLLARYSCQPCVQSNLMHFQLQKLWLSVEWTWRIGVHVWLAMHVVLRLHLCDVLLTWWYMCCSHGRMVAHVLHGVAYLDA